MWLGVLRTVLYSLAAITVCAVAFVAGIVGARLCLGVAFMLLVAAFIEAFWSSVASIPYAVKYAVAAVLWTGVIVWLWRGGRGGADKEHDAR